jgi:pSer/pThr/pTyr-binding forkhead associated (FHA) protein
MSDEVIVGRDAGNGVSIQDGSVSTRHARITRTPEGFVLEDLKSRNGTFVNGEPVKEKRLLVDNDLIRFGRVVLTFNTAREIAPGERTIIEKIP